MLNTVDMETINGLVAKMGLEDISIVNERMSLQRTFLGKDIMRGLTIGDKVSFVGRRGITVEGTVLKVKIKNVTVDTGVARWNVPASMLTKVA
tara:strand:+ start:1116 stop:1394 length:279 start_codon:yes stop_codon:yes gene_type:complete